MRNVKLALLAFVLLVISGCGGGGDSINSDADRFVGDWHGTMIEQGRDDGGELSNIVLDMHIEYAGKENIGGVTVEYISVSIYWGNVLVATGTDTAQPGGTWNVTLSEQGFEFEMLGQFIGNVASGSFTIIMDNPDPPFNTINIWGTWSCSKV